MNSLSTDIELNASRRGKPPWNWKKSEADSQVNTTPILSVSNSILAFSQLLVILVLSEQHGKLKQHANDLETALSQREATLVQLQATNLSASKKHDLTDEEQKMRIRQLLEDLNNQTSKCESIERQVRLLGHLVLWQILQRYCSDSTLE